jgi:large subunit ribosomal protein L5
MARLMRQYFDGIRDELSRELEVSNALAVPRLQKIIISMGLGKALQEKKRLEAAVNDLGIIAGQRPAICKAKKSVSNFKVRQGYEIGCKVTLRGRRMYEFLDRLINLAVPRMRDFRGLSTTSFDGRGNYSMGVPDQTIFPEIDIDKVEFQQGMNITFVTTARDDEQCRRLLTKLGMPFRRTEEASGN